MTTIQKFTAVYLIIFTVGFLLGKAHERGTHHCAHHQEQAPAK